MAKQSANNYLMALDEENKNTEYIGVKVAWGTLVEEETKKTQNHLGLRLEGLPKGWPKTFLKNPLIRPLKIKYSSFRSIDLLFRVSSFPYIASSASLAFAKKHPLVHTLICLRSSDRTERTP